MHTNPELSKEREIEMNEKDWHNRIFCVHCQWSRRAYHGSMFHSVNGLSGCCPGCGTNIEEQRMVPKWGKPFIMKVVKWIPDYGVGLFGRRKKLRTGQWQERKG